MRKWWRKNECRMQLGDDAVYAHKKLGWQFWALAAGAVLFLVAALVGGWYVWALRPLDAAAEERHQRVVISDGDTAYRIAHKLEEAGIIRSAFAMRIYTEVSGTRSKLQVGGYLINSSESVPEIVDHLVSGRTDEYNLTILSGLTVAEIEESLRRDGYGKTEITTALNESYNHPLLANRPPGATLEGYIFPETYRVSAAASLEQLFERTFDELYGRLQEDKLLTSFRQKGLSLYEAVTLASIIQEEVSDPREQRLVAQVFLKRLAIGMPLGSDPTFRYAAKQMGVEPRVGLESPYNTRINKGLPPGPIANMEYSALQAVANPAKTDYLYFVAGDDGTTYFSKTLEEHEAKTAKYCTTLCQ